MQSLPKGILFDLDDTIISSGDRHQLVLDIATEYQDRLGQMEPTELANEIESAFIKFWADEHLHKIWRFRLLDARLLIISEVFETLQDRSPSLTPEFSREFAEQFSWRRCAEEFLRNLEPLPRPRKKRFWRRLRALRRLRRTPLAA